MKKIFFIGLSFLLVFCSETSGETYYTLYNDTDKTVTVRAFGSKSMTLLDVINIRPLSQHSQKQTTGFEDTQNRAFYSEFGVDSVRVIFNMSRVVVYTAYEGDNTNLEI